MRQPAPPHLRKELLVPLLAYKIQEQAYGGLSASARRKLRELAQQYEHTRDKPPAASTIEIKPGTRLLRQWQGNTHHVTACEKDFEYKGQQYRSLSEIARLITGTRWSGPLFFGLKQHQQKKVQA